ncbi:MAG: putative inorganic carbon transporter subunit DabA [Woeseiaceae bacterium]
MPATNMLLQFLPLLAPIALLAAAGVAFVQSGPRPAFVSGISETAAIVSLLASVSAAALVIVQGPGTLLFLTLGDIGISTRLDVVSGTMLILVSFVGWIVLRFSASYLDGEARQGAFFGWLAATLAAVLFLVQAGNLFLLLGAWVMTSFCLHRLLLFYPTRVQAVRAARKKFIVARISDAALAAACVLLFINYETADIATILAAARDGVASPQSTLAAGFIALAALIKSAQFPFHGWLTEVMETPTPVSALLHAGVVNAGGFLLIRFADVMLLSPATLAVLVVVGGITALVAALTMLAQPAVKTSLAWSTIAQMGFMIMQCGLALFPLALLHIVAHSLYKAHAFLASGNAVDTVAAIRRPGPIAIPGARAVVQAFLLALGIYAVIALAFGLDNKPPQAIVLGAILVLGVAYLLVQGLADAAPRVLTRRTAVYAVAVSIGYFLLQTGIEWMTKGALPETPAPGSLQWAQLVLAVLSFGLVAVAQALFPLWSNHPAAAGFRVHLANGLYANALFDRWLGNWRMGADLSSPAPDKSPQSARNDDARRPTEGACERAVRVAAQHIPPVWPLASSVAVNPFLGQTNETLADTAARLDRIGGTPVTMPRDWYLRGIDSGEISDDDLADALAAAPHSEKPADLDGLKRAAKELAPEPAALASVAHLAARATGIDWSGFLTDRFGVWAGSYFDRGQALWSAPQDKRAWTAYCAYATHDLAPEIMGVKRFAAFVADAPDDPIVAINRAATRLGLEDDALESYFHQLLFSLGGWAQYARYHLWRAELANQDDATITDLLAIRLLWEEALYDQYASVIDEEWAEVQAKHSSPVSPSAAHVIDEILQEAAERSAQRALADTFATPAPPMPADRPLLQAAFCIDVRSEVFRRALESVNTDIQTLGFAGFFGVSAKHRRFASDVQELRLPVLLNPTVTSCATSQDTADADRQNRYAARVSRAWGRFKFAAVSSFAFVEAMGPVYVAKLTRDALGCNPMPVPNDPPPRFEPPLDLETRTDAAETVLRAMSLTSGFASVVLLAGHGANVVNNPHASGLHCGACGGYSGEVNARLLAQLLNDSDVRVALVRRGINVPHDTIFVAGLHDTTTDRVHLYDDDRPVHNRDHDLEPVRRWLEAAGQATRAERSLRLPRAAGEGDIANRASDWAEIRPEWGLAGCKAFIAAPRARTRGRNLQGRAFLHDYDWKQDKDNEFAVLELIMTAPVVVASWISLQYYGSTVAPDSFGSGNKLLHNVVGGIGVFEGNGGVLRAGLPWQSVHDGVEYVHEPVRLSVCIEAPRKAMNEILSRHAGVRALFDNRWLHLFAINEDGHIAYRYAGDLEWVSMQQPAAPRMKVVA